MMFKRLSESVSYLGLCLLILTLSGMCGGAYAATYQYEITAGDYTLEATEEGIRPRMAGFGQLTIPGKPVLPSRVFNIAVPPNSRILNVSVQAAAAVPIRGKHGVAPAGLGLPVNPDPELEEKLRKQYQDNLDKAYQTDAVHPGKPAEYIGAGGYRHYQLVKVRFTPMSYQALSKRLNVIPKAVVTIEYEPSDDPVEAVKSSPEIERIASEIIANYDDAKTAYESAVLQSGVLSTDTHPYVIICPASLQDSVKVLYNWEIIKANNPIIVTVEQIESESTGIDRAERIRNFLRSKLGVWGIQYVLLVGTLSDIPVRYYGYPGSDGMKGPTDYYYAELSLPDNQSWDYNQDGIYAERGDDHVDFIAEVHVGRLPFSAPAVVESVCRRIVEFEYMNDMTYKKRALFAMSFLDQHTDSAVLSEKMRNDFLVPGGWATRRLYENGPGYFSTYPMNFALTYNNLKSSLTDVGYGLTVYSGHGNHTSAGYSGGSFINSAMCADLNDDKPSIFWAISCQNAWPEDSGNLGKSLLGRGAAAFGGCSRSVIYSVGWSQLGHGRAYTMAYLFNQAVKEGKPLGRAMNDSHTLMHDVYGHDQDWHQILLYMLYGSPNTRIAARPAVLPNLKPFARANWMFPVLVSNQQVTPGTTPPLTELDVGAFYIRAGFANDEPSMAMEFRSDVSFSGAVVGSEVFPPTGERYFATYNHQAEVTEGGRYTVGVALDPNNYVYESNESDNTFHLQFVWKPRHLTTTWSYLCPLPAPIMDIGVGMSYPNCHGYKFTVNPGTHNDRWSAVGVLWPDSEADNDLRLWGSNGYTNAYQGFGGNWLTTSEQPQGLVDFVVVNGNVAAAGDYYAGVINANANTSYYEIQHSKSQQIQPRPSTQWTSGSMSYVDVVRMYECYLTPGTWHFELKNDGGTNLGISLYHKDGSHFKKSESISSSNSGGPGADEYFQVQIASAGYYGLAVWKSGSGDHGNPQSGEYRIGFGNTAVLTVIQPNGGEVWFTGEHKQIRWESFGYTGATVKIELSRNGGSTWSALADNVPNNGSYSWTASGATSDNCRIRVTSNQNSAYTDVSNSNFYIGPLPHALTNDSPASFSQVPKDFSFQVIPGKWCAVGIRPSTDHDIKADSVGNFASPYALSVNGGTIRDFVVTNWVQNPEPATHYAQVYYGIQSEYKIEAEWEAQNLAVGTTHNASLTANEVLDVFQVNLNSGVSYRIALTNVSGTGNISARVYRPDISSGTRNSAHYRAVGPEMTKILEIPSAAGGVYGIVVVNEGDTPCVYSLKVAESQAVAGVVRDSHNAPMAGVAIAGFSYDVVTGVDGTYRAAVEKGWSGTATPVFADCTFTPETRTYNSVTNDLLDEDYIGERKCGEVSFSPDGGAFTTSKVVTLSCPTANVRIHYTTDGLDPTENDPSVASGGTVTVSVNPPTTLKARASRTSYTPSPVKTAYYQLPMIYVSLSGNDANPGTSWAQAKRHVQTAVNSIPSDGNTWQVWVEKGTYNELITLRDKVELYGGFTGAETALAQRPAFPRPAGDPNQTVLTGNSATAIVTSEMGVTSASRVDGFTISGNTMGRGLNIAEASPTIAKNTIKNNTAGTGYGGGIALYASSSLVTGNIITGNSASRGGGISCGSSPAVIVNNMIFDNNSVNGGSAVYIQGDSPSVTNNTLISNTDQTAYGTIRLLNSFASLSNNIVAHNSSGGIKSVGGNPTLRNNNVYHNKGYEYDGIPPGTGDISVDSGFVNLGSFDLHISVGSPCVNAGWNSAPGLPAKDIDGDSRVFAGFVDIGADECVGMSNRVIHVSTSGNNANSGLSWATAKQSVQAAIHTSIQGDEVWVSAGEYGERITLKHYVKVYGGFTGAETSLSQRPAFPRQIYDSGNSVLNGYYQGVVVSSQAGLNSSSRLDGFTITGGSGATYGGGILIQSASPTISNNTIMENSAGRGGGLSAISSGSVIEGNLFYQNYAFTDGGGIFVQGGGPRFGSNVIMENTADGSGGGLCTQAASARLANNTIAGNQAGQGGGIMVQSGSPSVVNNVVAFNNQGIDSYGTPDLRFNNVFGNTEGNYGGCSPGQGSISADPMFTDADKRVSPQSPCVNAGTIDWGWLPQTDRDGNPRVLHGMVDIGAYEFHVSGSPATVREAKFQPDGSQVQVVGAVVSAAWNDYCYIESDDRSSGLRVEMNAHGVIQGMRANVTGIMRTSVPHGERFIEAMEVTQSGSGFVLPLGMLNRTLGGSDFNFDPATGAGQRGVHGGVGLNNIGLLVRVWGRVVEVEASANPTWMVIDDGSGRMIRVISDGGDPSIEQKWLESRIVITGISSCLHDGQRINSVIRARRFEVPAVY